MTPPARKPPAGSASPEPLSLEAALSGILALLAEERERNARPDDPKIEVVLARAGLSNDDIGKVLGKKSDAVRKAIARAK